MHPTLLVHNANILADPTEPAASHYSAIAIFHDRVAALGDDDDLQATAGPATEIIDAGGRLILPGFVDSHIHLYDAAVAQHEIDLRDARTLEEVLERVAEATRRLPEGAWIRGGGWNNHAWGQAAMPTRHDLDRVAPNHPVALDRMDMHSMWLNSLALENCEIGRELENPEGGAIDRERDGTPTGILRERAMEIAYTCVGMPSEEALADSLMALIGTLHRLGITGAHDQRVRAEGPLMWRALQRLQQEDRLTLRTLSNIHPDQLPHVLAAGLQSGFGNDWFRLGWLKMFADGTLGSRTALMLEPFEGEPENLGMRVGSPEDIYELSSLAAEHGIATTIHAIGDRANREVLDLFADLRERFDPSLRHKIEHIQVIHPDDIARVGQLGVAGSVQPAHVSDDWQPADRYWGRRARYAYAFRSLLDAGVTLAFGSDAPVAPANPMWGLHAAVNRQNLRGEPEGGWYPEERITIREAIAAYTVGPAVVAGNDDRLGRLQPGFLADLIILDRDVTAVDPASIKQTRVLLTVAGGRVVYRDSAL